jgi:hypothetical protein
MIIVEAGGFVIRDGVTVLHEIGKSAFQPRLDLRPILPRLVQASINRVEQIETYIDQMVQLAMDGVA